MLIYVYTDVFLYPNITTIKGKDFSWIKCVSVVHNALYISTMYLHRG